jgi:hypothetical protein
MKERIKLFKKLIYIIIPVIVLVILFEVKARNIENGFELKKSLFEENIDNIEVLILGSSHAYINLNPEIINEKSFDIANNSQDLYYDYMLFDKYKDKLKNLKCIILSISCFSLWYDLNETPEKWRKFFFKKYFDINPRNNLSLSEITDAKSYSYAFFYRLENVFLRSLSTKTFSFGCDMNSYGWNTDTDNCAIDSTEFSIEKGKERVNFINSLVNKYNYLINKRFIDELKKYANNNNIN